MRAVAGTGASYSHALVQLPMQCRARCSGTSEEHGRAVIVPFVRFAPMQGRIASRFTNTTLEQLYGMLAEG